MLLTLAWNQYLVGVLMVLFLVICGMLILTVLVQRPQGGGLAAAFGGGSGSGQTAFGTKTGDALTVLTIAMFVVYLLAAIVLNYGTRIPSAGSEKPAAESTSAPATSPSGGPAPVDPAVKPEGAAPVEVKPEGTAPVGGTPAAAPESAPAPTPAPAGAAKGPGGR